MTTERRLQFTANPKGVGLETIVWQPSKAAQSSLQVSLRPSLTDLGRVQKENRDFVWLAACAFIADRTIARRQGWTRDIVLEVPALAVDAWQSCDQEFSDVLMFLTSDKWRVRFRQLEEKLKDGPVRSRPEVERVCLFSGGADSMCGALRALARGDRIALVSHWDWSVHAGVQKALVKVLRDHFKVDIPHRQIRLGRASTHLDGSHIPDEPTRRSRSILFLALGLATASISPATPLWIPENGFASLNPPLASERRGALSTRTTHPHFLDNIGAILAKVGAHAEFQNPFAVMTKGEMFGEVRDLLGRKVASEFLSATHSCAHARWAGLFGLAPQTHCGACFGCLVRRAAFIKSEVPDSTIYLIDELSGQDRSRFLGWPAVQRDLEAMRYATSRRIGYPEVLAIPLPTRLDPTAVLDLIQRGFAELSLVHLPTV